MTKTFLIIKPFKLFLTSVILVVAMCACDYDNGGFPDKVNLSDKMTETTVSGTSTIQFFTVSEESSDRFEYVPDDYQTQTRPDSLIATLDWLTIKVKYNDNKIKLIANRPQFPEKEAVCVFPLWTAMRE